MRKVLPICFYVISILGMLAFTYYDTSKYPGSEHANSYIADIVTSHFFAPVVILMYLVFIGLVIYEAWIITTTGPVSSTKKISVVKKNVILFLAVVFAILNICVIVNLINEARNKSFLAIIASSSSKVLQEHERKREILKLTSYTCYLIASVIPLVLAIIIRIGRTPGKPTKVMTIIASIFAVLMGANWIGSYVDKMSKVLIKSYSEFRIVPGNLVLVLLMLAIAVIVTVSKKNQLKGKWILSIVLVLAILNVPFISFFWSKDMTIHLSMVSRSYAHYTSGFRATDGEVDKLIFIMRAHCK